MDSRTTWPSLIGALIRGETLSADETSWAMAEIMEGAATPVQIAGFGVALLSSIVCYGLEMIALRRMATRVFGILMSLEPAAAALAGFLVLHELLGLREIAALLMVSIASIGITIGATLLASGVLPLTFTRGRHLSWLVLFTAGALVLAWALR